MSYCYLVTNKETGAKTLVEASSPAVAIAHVSGDAFSAQRVEGSVLDVLKASLPVAKAGRASNETGEPGAQEPGGEASPPGDGGDKPETPAATGKGAKS